MTGFVLTDAMFLDGARAGSQLRGYAPEAVSPVPGLFYFEVTLTGCAAISNMLIGVCGATFSLTDSIDVAVASTNVTQAQFAGWSWAAASSAGLGWGYPNRVSGGPVAQAGHTIGVAVDTASGASKLWARNSTTNSAWTGNGGASPDPTTGVNGFDISTQITGDVYIVVGGARFYFDSDNTDTTVVLNAGTSAFVRAAPSGSTAWGALASTILNGLDRDSRVSLSGGSLTATVSMPSFFAPPPYSRSAFVRADRAKPR